MDLTPEVMVRLKQNDPEIISVSIIFSAYHSSHILLTFSLFTVLIYHVHEKHINPICVQIVVNCEMQNLNNKYNAVREIDRKEEGHCISHNTHLKSVAISDSGTMLVRRSLTEEDFINMAYFFDAVACNTSITTFSFWSCDNLAQLMFLELGPKFGGVNGLRKLSLVNMCHLDAAIDIKEFASALEKCGDSGSTLEDVEISCCSTRGDDEMSSDEAMCQLINAFNKYCNLVRLEWAADSGDGMGNMAVQSLARLINNPRCTLEEFSVCCKAADPGLMNWRELCQPTQL